MQRTKRLTILAMVMTLAASGLFASSHREAPLTSEDPTIDATDLYAFRDSPTTVTILANYIPLEAPAGGPNFYNFSDNAYYDIHIDNDGDAVADITWRFDFYTEVGNAGTFLYNTGPVTSLSDPDLNVKQYYSVNRMNEDGSMTSMGERFQVAPANVGVKSTPDYASLAAAAVNTMDNGMQIFAGPRDDPFFIDLGAIFDLLTLRPVQSLHQVPPVEGNEAGVDSLAGFNVHTIALRIPIAGLTNDGQMPNSPTASNAVVGVWTTSSRPRVTIRNEGLRPVLNFSGSTQVSRLGNPLVNEVVLPLAFKDLFNSSKPSGDAALFNTNEAFRARILAPEVANLMELLYGLNVPEPPRNDLVSVFLTGVEGLNMPANVVPSEMLRLNMAILGQAGPSRLGVIGQDNAGYPNGRRLGDDVVDIALRVVAGVLVDGFNVAPNNALTDGVDGNDKPFLTSFPYAAMPHPGSEFGTGAMSKTQDVE